jgi:hypothetical protein
MANDIAFKFTKKKSTNIHSTKKGVTNTPLVISILKIKDLCSERELP